VKTCGEFYVHQHTIPFKKYGDVIVLIPFGDVHRDDENCAEEKWLQFLDWAKLKRQTSNIWFLGMGDYQNILRATERGILQSASLGKKTVTSLEDWWYYHINRFYEEISFMRGRILGLLEGNHYVTFQNNTTSTQYLCQKLGCAYLGCNAFIRLIISKDEHHAHQLDIFAHHGKGGGSTSGGSINTVEKMQHIAEASIFLQGHDHRKMVSMQSKLYLSNTKDPKDLKVRHKKIISARTGSFLKAYESGKQSYVVDKLLRPTDLGVVKIEIQTMRKKTNGDVREIDVHVSI